MRPSQYDRDLGKLNELIDWYTKYGKPPAGTVILVRFRREQLDKFAQHIHGTNQWKYRDRILVNTPPGGQHAKTQTETRTETNSSAGAGAGTGTTN